MRGTADEVRCRRGNDNDIGLACKSDVIERVTRTEDFRMHGPPSDRFEGDGADELTGAACHYDVDFSAALCKQTRQPH